MINDPLAGPKNPGDKMLAKTCGPHLIALLIYGSSRVVVVWAVYIAPRIISPHLPLVLSPHLPPVLKTVPSTSWYHGLLRWDAAWYATILSEGYQYDGNDLVEQSITFYPLYSLIARALTIIPGIDGLVALLVVANIAAVLSVLLLFKYVRAFYGDAIALLTVAFLSFFPTSFFLSAGYTESLALLLILCFFLSLKRSQYALAAFFAGLTCATRSTGVVLLPVLMWELWRTSDRRLFWSNALLCSIVATSGLWLYMLYLWAAFGNPFAFVTGKTAWHLGGLGENFMSALLLKGVRQVFTARDLANPRTFDLWFFLLFLTLTIVYRKWLPSSLFLFAIGVLMLPYLTITGGPVGFLSMTRYALLAFPVFLVMAKICESRPWLVPCITGVFAAMLFTYSALFSQWYWVE